MEVVRRHRSEVGLDLGPCHFFGFFQRDAGRFLGELAFGIVDLVGDGLGALPLLVQLADRTDELLRIRVGVQRCFTLWREGPDAFVLDQPAGLDRRHGAEAHDLLEATAAGFVVARFVLGEHDLLFQCGQRVCGAHAFRLSLEDMEQRTSQFPRAAPADIGHLLPLWRDVGANAVLNDSRLHADA